MKTLLETKIKNYEEELQDLVGKSIAAIYYYESVYEAPLWDEGVYHSLDYGLEIITTQDEHYYFIWGNEFEQFDVKFKKGDILTEFASEISFNKYDVTETFQWKTFLSKEIKGVHVNWSYWEFIGKKEKRYYPQDVILEFVNHKKIIISALEIQEGKASFGKDHISVFFNEEVFRNFIKIKKERKRVPFFGQYQYYLQLLHDNELDSTVRLVLCF